MMDQKILLIIGAAVVVFLPQIVATVKSVFESVKTRLSKTAGKSKATPPKETINTEPADWINDLFTIQQILLMNDRQEAADLLGQAMVKIIDAPRIGGSKR